MKIQYDRSADALYISLKKGKTVKTVKMKDRVLVDTDRAGDVIGIEVLDVSLHMPKKQLSSIEVGLPISV